MKYQRRRNDSLFFAVILGLWSVGAAILMRFKLQNVPLKFRILMIVIVLLMFAFVGYFLYLALRSGAYAMIEDDGIRIFSPKAGELASVAWTDVRDCRQTSEGNRSYLILIRRYDAVFCGKPLATYQGHPSPDEKTANQYLLDELMVRLDHGKMTAEELRELPLILMQINGFSARAYQKYHSMWRAAKTRAAEQEETT